MQTKPKPVQAVVILKMPTLIPVFTDWGGRVRLVEWVPAKAA